MALTRDRLVTAFPEDEISTTTPEHLPSGITNPAVKRILTEVGLPEDVVGCVFFEDIDKSVRTLADQRGSEPTPPEIADHYILGISDYHTICFDGATGECLFVNDDADNVPLAASSVDSLLDFMCLLNVELSTIDDGATDDDLDHVEARLIAQLRQADPDAVTASETEWRTLIGRCIGEVML